MPGIWGRMLAGSASFISLFCPTQGNHRTRTPELVRYIIHCSLSSDRSNLRTRRSRNTSPKGRHTQARTAYGCDMGASVAPGQQGVGGLGYNR